MLSAQEIEHYQQHGYVVPRFAFDEDRIAALRAALDELLVRNPGIRPEQLVSVHIAGRNAEGVHGSEAIFELALDPALLDCVEALIGDDIILWGCQAFCKPAGDGMEVPWHQDGHYWPIRPLATCTVWIAIDDSTVENGCLRLVPGSHAERRLYDHVTDDRDHLTLNRTVLPEHLSASEMVDVELRAGQMSLHDVYMLHGSNPNHSTKRRAGLAIRYMPSTSHFRRDLYETTAARGYLVDFATRPLWLLRGIDRCAKNDFSIGHR